MKVHFGCSSIGIAKQKESYLLICRTIKELGHTITRDWLNEAVGYIENKKKHSIDWGFIFRDVSKSIFACDVAVFENTISSFSTGFQFSLALQQKKPILMLYSKGGERNYKDTFASAIESDLITFKKYAFENIEEILSNFFAESVKGGEKTRFNFLIDKKMENYLDWAAFTYKKSKSDIIRELMSEQMIHNDPNYKKYLDSIS